MMEEYRQTYISPNILYEDTGCLKPCSYTDYRVERAPYHTPSSLSHSLNEVTVSMIYADVVIEREEDFLQFDGLELTGELGGFLGLFLGLSFYEVLSLVIGCVQRMRCGKLGKTVG